MAKENPRIVIHISIIMVNRVLSSSQSADAILQKKKQYVLVTRNVLHQSFLTSVTNIWSFCHTKELSKSGLH